eukprot:CAMPEP_0185024336 /NCGR_PEP_ID=MMETSP1103-20130426/7365_1 /TAXON_ID=36769 /ORGANISM="Paraphysomonas bandaiensis, Strain Caron Lab Isolate" /LENGTH=278 /DNA_ID=CAMNT_0027557271 /DNA_START=45 /DNA_END=881 /DNA_ORIENTATION=+
MDLAELAMMLESINATEVSDSEFEQAASRVSSYSWLPDDQKLQFYALYKQSTIGDVNTKQPWSINMVAKAKWDAWKAYEGFPKKSAAMAYVYLANELEAEDCARRGIECSKSGDNDSEGDTKRSAEEQAMSVTVSTFKDPINGDIEKESWTESEEIFQAVVNGDLEGVKKSLLGGTSPSLRDSEKMTPLHYAADRGHIDILTTLVDGGADLNALDSEGQTPLMLAVMCENEEVVQVLLSNGADCTIRNSSGESALDMVDGDSSDGRAVLAMLQEASTG